MNPGTREHDRKILGEFYFPTKVPTHVKPSGDRPTSQFKQTDLSDEAGYRLGIALETMLPALRCMAHNSAVPLASAIRVAVAGNLITELESSVEVGSAVNKAWTAATRGTLNHDRTDELLHHVTHAGKIVFLANTEVEAIWDRILIELLGPKITAVVMGIHADSYLSLSDMLVSADLIIAKGWAWANWLHRTASREKGYVLMASRGTPASTAANDCALRGLFVGRISDCIDANLHLQFHHDHCSTTY